MRENVMTEEEIEDLTTTEVHTPIDNGIVKTVLSQPPFIDLKYVVNIRDIGGYGASNIRGGRIFRSGMFKHANNKPEVMTWLNGHVKRIFDLRTASERGADPDPVVSGMENVWFEGEGEYTQPVIEDFFEDGGRTGWKMQLMKVVLHYKPTIRAILEHIRDRSDPFLFHCTAGRDRTGVVAGLLLHLAGTPSNHIVFDYMLSRIGIEPARDEFMRMAMSRVLVYPELLDQSFTNLVSLKAEFWEGFLEELEERFGGWEGYVTKPEGLGFTLMDLETIKMNLRN